jgi:hypothetical protein
MALGQEHDEASMTSQFLAKIRPTLKYACNRALLDYLAAFPRSRKISIYGKQYIELSGGDGGSMFLPLAKGKPRELWFPCSVEMQEFYAAFDGLRETRPRVNGHFESCADVHSIDHEFDDPDDYPNFFRHSSCPVIFSAANGDVLIQKRDGKFAWCVLGEGRVRQAAKDFPSLLKQYVTHRSKSSLPFDPYA